MCDVCVSIPPTHFWLPWGTYLLGLPARVETRQPHKLGDTMRTQASIGTPLVVPALGSVVWQAGHCALGVRQLIQGLRLQEDAVSHGIGQPPLGERGCGIHRHIVRLCDCLQQS